MILISSDGVKEVQFISRDEDDIRDVLNVYSNYSEEISGFLRAMKNKKAYISA
jgi:hypothetical protein